MADPRETAARVLALRIVPGGGDAPSAPRDPKEPVNPHRPADAAIQAASDALFQAAKGDDPKAFQKALGDFLEVRDSFGRG